MNLNNCLRFFNKVQCYLCIYDQCFDFDLYLTKEIGAGNIFTALGINDEEGLLSEMFWHALQAMSPTVFIGAIAR